MPTLNLKPTFLEVTARFVTSSENFVGTVYWGLLLGLVILFAHSYKITRMYQLETVGITVNSDAKQDTEIGI